MHINTKRAAVRTMSRGCSTNAPARALAHALPMKLQWTVLLQAQSANPLLEACHGGSSAALSAAVDASSHSELSGAFTSVALPR